MANREYEHKGTVHVFGPKPPKNENPWPGLIIGGIVILLIVASCST